MFLRYCIYSHLCLCIFPYSIHNTLQILLSLCLRTQLLYWNSLSSLLAMGHDFEPLQNDLIIRTAWGKYSHTPPNFALQLN